MIELLDIELSTSGRAVATFIARTMLGVLFFFKGYDAVFKVGIGNIKETYQDSFAARGIPHGVSMAGIIFTSYVELIAGALLLLGVFKYFALYLLGFDLLLAAAAFSIARPMWDTQHVLTRLVLLVFLLITPYEWDVYTLQNFISNH